MDKSSVYYSTDSACATGNQIIWLDSADSNSRSITWTDNGSCPAYLAGVWLREPAPRPSMIYPAKPAFTRDAEKKAKDLLKDIIGEQQLKLLEEGHYMELELDRDHIYRFLKDLTHSRQGSRQWKKIRDEWKEFCIVPTEELPWGDQIINKIVPLLSDPDGCERIANWL